MTKSRLTIALFAVLLVLPTASRVSAGDDPPPPPKTRKEKKKVVVSGPDGNIVVDDGGVFVDGDFGPEVLADIDFDDFDLPGKFQWTSAGGYIGVRPIPMTPELRTHFGAPEAVGVFVGTVEKDGPAEKAGLAVGDIVTAVDGSPIASPRDLARAVRRKKDGDNVQVDVVRGGAKKSLTVKVAERPQEEMRVGDLGPGMRHKRIWISPPETVETPETPVTPLPPRWRGLEDRIHELEQRLQELESRLPKN